MTEEVEKEEEEEEEEVEEDETDESPFLLFPLSPSFRFGFRGVAVELEDSESDCESAERPRSEEEDSPEEVFNERIFTTETSLTNLEK